jgi:hypothetical protein
MLPLKLLESMFSREMRSDSHLNDIFIVIWKIVKADYSG